MLTHDILFKRSPLDFIAFYSPLHANKWKFDIQPWGPFTITVQSSDFVWDPYTGGIPYYLDVSYCNL